MARVTVDAVSARAGRLARDFDEACFPSLRQAIRQPALSLPFAQIAIFAPSLLPSFRITPRIRIVVAGHTHSTPPLRFPAPGMVSSKTSNDANPLPSRHSNSAKHPAISPRRHCYYRRARARQHPRHDRHSFTSVIAHPMLILSLCRPPREDGSLLEKKKTISAPASSKRDRKLFPNISQRRAKRRKRRAIVHSLSPDCPAGFSFSENVPAADEAAASSLRTLPVTTCDFLSAPCRTRNETRANRCSTFAANTKNRASPQPKGNYFLSEDSLSQRIIFLRRVRPRSETFSSKKVRLPVQDCRKAASIPFEVPSSLPGAVFTSPRSA